MTHSKEWIESWKKPNLKNGFNERGYWIDGDLDKLVLGHAVDISKFVYIHCGNGVYIDDNVEIGQHCSILSHSSIGERNGFIYIGKRTCIGSHSTIMPNVSIGDDCIIGAYSYVDKDLPKGTRYIPNKLKGL